MHLTISYLSLIHVLLISLSKAPESLFRTLKSELGVDVECFASPLNAFFGSFCSAFADTDRYFGSHGSFFNLRPEALSGSFECNPPFVDEVMFACALHIDHLLSSALPLSITVIVPHWVDTRFIPHMHQSQYCRRSLIVPAGQHRYVSGSQHHVGASELHDQRQMLNSRYFQAAHDTIVFVLQNDAGAAKWPIDEQKCDRILKGFA
jgi:phosphorylated CTD-interacting factor 1